jgi:hypothetical protein
MVIGGAGTQPNDVSSLMIVGAVLLVGWALTFIGDLFLIPGRVREHKERLRQQDSMELGGASQAMVQR